MLDRLPHKLPHTLVFNKIDLTGRVAGMQNDTAVSEVAVSAHTGEGVDELREHLKTVMGYRESGAGGFSARRRHLDALRRAGHKLENAQSCLDSSAGELLAEELRLAQQCLSEITGEFTSDDLLGEIFSSFCIGK